LGVWSERSGFYLAGRHRIGLRIILIETCASPYHE
jgi:hypothetical protein